MKALGVLVVAIIVAAFVSAGGGIDWSSLTTPNPDSSIARDAEGDECAGALGDPTGDCP